MTISVYCFWSYLNPKSHKNLWHLQIDFLLNMYYQQLTDFILIKYSKFMVTLYAICLFWDEIKKNPSFFVSLIISYVIITLLFENVFQKSYILAFKGMNRHNLHDLFYAGSPSRGSKSRRYGHLLKTILCCQTPLHLSICMQTQSICSDIGSLVMPLRELGYYSIFLFLYKVF